MSNRISPPFTPEIMSLAPPESVLATSGDYHLSLTSESAGRFRGALKEFLRQSECEFVALIEHSGAVLLHESSPAAAAAARRPNPDTLGVLAAGLFGSTQMLARELGESGAPEVFCHGAGRHFFVCPVSETFALLAVFDETVVVGVVRLNAHRAAAIISASLKEVVKSRTGYGEVSSIPTAPAENPFLRYN